MKYIDNFLNKITMYRLMLWGLMALAFVTVVFGFLGILPYGGVRLLISFFTFYAFCFFLNYIFANMFSVKWNVESNSITAGILFFIVYPVNSFSDFILFVVLSLVAMGSKYTIILHKKHVFNPAAFAVFAFGLAGSGLGIWWVGSKVMLIPVAILGFLILRKVKRFTLFFSFFAVAAATILVYGTINGEGVLEILKELFNSWPIIFFGSIMLTEPLTMPTTKKLQIIYAVIVGFFFGAEFQFGPLYSSPALALLLGNLFTYLVSPRARLRLTLLRKEKVTEDVLDFHFKSDEKLKFQPGQYLEWTIDPIGADFRGNRRYFTIASSPTEENILLGTKFYPKPSTFKQKLQVLNPGDEIIASQLSGEFTLPKNAKKKLVFIAGGIGVTPFRSMAKYLLDKKELRDIQMFYSNKTIHDIAYKNILDSAKEIGWHTTYVVGELTGNELQPDMKLGFITKEMIVESVLDYNERVFYISGTHGMVVAFTDILRQLGIPKRNIKTDFFPGFV